MARVEVHGGKVDGDHIASLDVHMPGLPPRTLDRDTALAWMRDGHSLIPVLGGQELPALQLVEIVDGDDVQQFIRVDTQKEAADALGPIAG